MSGAVYVAIAAAIGNLLQGWDNATIAGAVLYIKREFKLESEPTTEGLIIATSLIGATFITTFSGPVADSIGRRTMLIISSVLYFVGGLVMLWSPNVYVLLLGRLLDGFGIGLAVTLVPVYISETAPPEIRGRLNTLPQFTGSSGMFMSYCMVFTMSLMEAPNWRLMLGVLSIPSLIYLSLAMHFLPESPRWLVSKGRLVEASQVLQKLRGREDVSGELALLIEGLGVGAETSIEEVILSLANDVERGESFMATKLQRRQSWMVKLPRGPSSLGVYSRHGSLSTQSIRLMDPLVPLLGTMHENLPKTGSTLFPSMGSIFGLAGPPSKNDLFDVDGQKEGAETESDADVVEHEDTLRSPLLSRQTTSTNNKDVAYHMGQNNSFLPSGEQLNGTEIGGGWQLAYRLVDKNGEGKEGGLQRIYLHQDGSAMPRHGSMFSVTGSKNLEHDGFVHAAALVSQSAVCPKDFVLGEDPLNPAKLSQSEAAIQRSVWKDLLEPGVKHALFVGVGIQILQQFSGINGVLYYTPQILDRAGVGVLLSHLGISSDSTSLLISALTTLFMMPSIMVAMRLMDVSGRRSLLLNTIPILIFSLIVLILGSVITISSEFNAAISTTSVILYFCFFVMGFGPVPNILCAEIFPTRVRGICIAICALTFWIGDIIVTYSLPLMLSSIGLVGVFSIYAVVCTIAWIFVFLQVPETKGMPLEVISEFFAVGAKVDKND